MEYSELAALITPYANYADLLAMFLALPEWSDNQRRTRSCLLWFVRDIAPGAYCELHGSSAVTIVGNNAS